MHSVLEYVLASSPQPPPLGSLDQWWAQHCALAERFPRAADVAVAGGFAADRLSYAFGSGYQAAGQAMTGAGATTLTALCATESGGAHPRAIETTLAPRGERWQLDGEKTFVTFGGHAERLLVVASAGDDDNGRKRLRLCALSSSQPGVSIEPLDQLPFVPEIPHARLRFDAVAVEPSQLLAGDGYTRYLKPFRTIEDCHVHAALLGWLLQLGRRGGWPQALRDKTVGAIVAIHALCEAEPSSPGVHVALAASIAQTHALLAEAAPCFATLDEATRERFERDRPLLDVAGKARARRLQVAREKLGR